MPFNGAGTFIPLPSPLWPAVGGTTILASDFNAVTDDIFDGLTLCLTRDGQAPLLGNIDCDGFKLINAGDASANGDYIPYDQLRRLGKKISSTSTDTFTSAAGNTSTQISAKTYIAPTSSSNVTYIGTLGDLEYTGNVDLTLGHLVAAFGFARMNAPGRTVELMIASEGKMQVFAGDVNIGLGCHAGLADVAVGSTLEIYCGTHTAVQDVKGHVEHLIGNGFGGIKVSGSVQNLVGLYMLPPVTGPEGVPQGNGTIGTMMLAHMPNITPSGSMTISNILAYSSKLNYISGQNRWNLWFDGTAPSYMGGPLLIGSKIIDGADLVQLTSRVLIKADEPFAFKNLTTATPTGPINVTPPAFYIKVNVGGVNGCIPVWNRI